MPSAPRGRGENEGSGECKGFDLEATERHFWKNVTYLPPIHGADVEGSLFDEIRSRERTRERPEHQEPGHHPIQGSERIYRWGEHRRDARLHEAALAARSREATWRPPGRWARS